MRKPDKKLVLIGIRKKGDGRFKLRSVVETTRNKPKMAFSHRPLACSHSLKG